MRRNNCRKGKIYAVNYKFPGKIRVFTDTADFCRTFQDAFINFQFWYVNVRIKFPYICAHVIKGKRKSPGRNRTVQPEENRLSVCNSKLNVAVMRRNAGNSNLLRSKNCCSFSRMKDGKFKRERLFYERTGYFFALQCCRKFSRYKSSRRNIRFRNRKFKRCVYRIFHHDSIKDGGCFSGKRRKVECGRNPGKRKLVVGKTRILHRKHFFFNIRTSGGRN